MTVAKQMDVRANIKRYFDIASSGEPVFIPRKGNRNVYIISQQDYEAFQKAVQNAEYLSMIDRSLSQFQTNETVTLTLDELRSME